jgi:Arc/MetJ-type ribon-helix-helix transcriptional regulator
VGRAMEKRSVTLDPDVAKAVDHHVAAGQAESFSAAINEAAARWAANRDLREALDAVYSDDPGARPSEDEVAAAVERLKAAADGRR